MKVLLLVTVLLLLPSLAVAQTCPDQTFNTYCSNTNQCIPEAYDCDTHFVCQNTDRYCWTGYDGLCYDGTTPFCKHPCLDSATLQVCGGEITGCWTNSPACEYAGYSQTNCVNGEMYCCPASYPYYEGGDCNECLNDGHCQTGDACVNNQCVTPQVQPILDCEISEVECQANTCAPVRQGITEADVGDKMRVFCFLHDNQNQAVSGGLTVYIDGIDELSQYVNGWISFPTTYYTAGEEPFTAGQHSIRIVGDGVEKVLPLNVIETESSPPIPTPPDFTRIFSWLVGVFQDILDAIINVFFPAGMVIDTNQELNPGDTFEYSLSVANSRSRDMPDTDYTDGVRTWAYTSYMIYSPSGQQLNQLELTELAYPVPPGATYPIDVSYTIPLDAEPGTYTAAGVLIEAFKVYNFNTFQWEDGDITEVDFFVVSFEVEPEITPPVPPDSLNIIERLIQFFMNLWISIKEFLGI